jgi:hypothetical protein
LVLLTRGKRSANQQAGHQDNNAQEALYLLDIAPALPVPADAIPLFRSGNYDVS